MEDYSSNSLLGWENKDFLAHYVHAKMTMKKVMDAAHARGMILRPITNSILRLAQMPEDLLNARLAAAIPQNAEESLKKIINRSKQREALALLVRRLVKRSMKVDKEMHQRVDNRGENEISAQNKLLYGEGALSSICFRTCYNSDLRKLARSETGEKNWENSPYSMTLSKHKKDQNHTHEIGPSPHYLKDLLLPGSKSLRKDLNAVLAFSASSDGKSYTPVGILVYGESDGTCNSSRPAIVPNSDPPRTYKKEDGLFRKFEKDYINFFKKDQRDISEITQPYYRPNLENRLLFLGQSQNSADKTNSLNAKSYNEFRENYAHFRTEKPSELQHRINEKRTAEIFILCAQSPTKIAYEKERFEILKDATTNAERSQLLSKLKMPEEDDSWSSLLLAFGLAFMATERISVKLNDSTKYWKPKFAAVVMKLFSDEMAVKEASTDEEKAAITRGTQGFRRMALKMGFTSQPVVRTKHLSANGLPIFKNLNISKNDFVSLHFPGKDYISLKLLTKNLPTEIVAENDHILGNVISSGASVGICPSRRGMGVVKCS